MQEVFEIRTKDGQSIKTINDSVNFIYPYYLIDILSKDEKEPNIEESENIEILKKIGIILYGIEILKKNAWAPRQKYIYYLRQKGLSKIKDSKEINKMPPNHFLQIDIANNKLRLVGNNISKNQKFTEWIYY